MSISRIPDPDFVRCIDCTLRRKHLRMTPKSSHPGRRIEYYCHRGGKPRELFGQRGCSKGKRASSPLLQSIFDSETGGENYEA